MISKLFGLGKKKTENQGNNSSNDSTEKSENRSVANALSYKEDTELNLRMENLSLFDNNVLLLDKLHERFCAKIAEFQ